MKTSISYAALILLFLFTLKVHAQTPKPEPWTAAQLMATQELADEIKAGKTKPVIINMGPQSVIKGSVDVGPGHEEPNLVKLKQLLAKTDKDKQVVIYCGCCPFEKCPNIRPAFNALKEQGFTNAKLLDIPKNIKVDWIDKGYPVNE